MKGKMKMIFNRRLESFDEATNVVGYPGHLPFCRTLQPAEDR